jgi:hypothetical protein
MHQDKWGNAQIGFCNPEDQFNEVITILAGNTVGAFAAVPADKTLQVLFIGVAYPAGAAADPSTGMFFFSATSPFGPALTINGAGPMPVSPCNWIVPKGEEAELGIFPAAATVDINIWISGRLLPASTVQSEEG